ncbi:hypothetical protein LINGRAHAP2_LOCUS26274 [Linum grandiflorum]
MQYQELCKRQ